MKKYKICITGGAGFVGTNLSNRLIQEGHKVIIIDNLSSGKKENINPKAKFYLEDIRSQNILPIFENEKFDYVYHKAAQIDVRKSIANPMYDLDVNGMGLLNVLENCKNNKVKKVIFASSGGVIYGNTKHFPTPETEEKSPESCYGVTKALGELYLNFYKKVHNLDYTIFRYSNIYGKYQDSHGEAGVIDIFINNIISKKPCTIYGDGLQCRDYIHVSDVVEANVLALSKGSGRAYNIASGRVSSVKEIYDIINSLNNHSGVLKYEKARLGELLRSEIDNTKAKKELHWTPRMNLEQGIKETLAYIKSKNSVTGQ